MLKGNKQSAAGAKFKQRAKAIRAGSKASAKIRAFKTGRLVRSHAVEEIPGTSLKIDVAIADTMVKTRKLRFGAVTVSHGSPDEATLVGNVEAGREALLRAKEALVTPGVILRHDIGIPKFRVDATNPKVLIRELNGHVDRGYIVNGAFVLGE